MKPNLRALFAFLFLAVAGLYAAPMATAATPPVLINEVLIGNASTNLDSSYGNYAAWIELHNTTGSAINLAGYQIRSLPDGADTPDVYTIPRAPRISLPARGYKLLWADEENNGAHLSLELDMDGGQIDLVAPGGAVLDSVTLGEQEPNVSYGRSPNAGAAWAYYDAPTPAAANTTPAFAAFDFAAAPAFAPPGGRFAGPQAVALSSATPGATIRYTTNGSLPTAASAVYNAPIAVNTTTVIRARAFAAGKMTGPTVTHTYFVNVNSSLPLVSLATDAAHLFDNRIGIYVRGTNGSLDCGHVANWNQSWERPTSFEFVESNGARPLAQDIGLEIHGRCSRGMAQKSLEIKARKTYGDNSLSYPLFSDKPLNSYRRLILRSGSQDIRLAMLRDPLSQQILVGAMDDIDRQAYRPALVYINGQFWGVYGVREKMDEAFVENTYDLDEDEFAFVEEERRKLVGNVDVWYPFYNQIAALSLSSDAAYATLRSQIDIDEYINYYIAEIYAGNGDWPYENVRYWRPLADGGRWRWLLFDLDATFAHPASQEDFTVNTLRNAMAPGRANDRHGSKLFRRLAANDAFQAEFAQRFAAHLNTTYAPARVVGIIDGMAATIAPDMPAQIARWGLPDSYGVWQAEVQKLRVFANGRPNALRNHLNEYLGSPGQTTLTIATSAGGRVRVAGGPLTTGYSGPHFRNTPLTLQAVPAQGYRFVRWQETNQTDAAISLTLSGPLTRTAVFEAIPLPPLVINELHYNPASVQGSDELYEFVEIVNTGAVAVNLAGMTLADGISHTFPAGASIAAGEIIVVAKTAASYAALPGVQVFQWSSGDLSNGGETISLKTADGNVIDSVAYLDIAPWPSAADGGGPSLSLLATNLNNSLPASWTASAAANGTPGAANFP